MINGDLQCCVAVCGGVQQYMAIYGEVKGLRCTGVMGCRVDVGFDEIDRLEKKKKYFASCTTYLVDSGF